MRNFLPSLLLSFVGGALAFCLLTFLFHDENRIHEQPAKASVLERILKSKKMRCAYWPWADFIEREPNTGVMKGPAVEIIDKVADSLGAKVEWVQEASMDDFVTLLDSNKVDAICGSFVPAPFLRPQAHFASPVFYVSYDVYVRQGDNRFSENQESLNKPDIRLLSLDGSAARYFSNSFFPKAQQNSLPSVVGAGQVLLDVKSNKADATVADQLTATRFIENNPVSLVMQRWNKPLVSTSSTPFITKKDDIVWASTLDGIIADLLDFGEIEHILSSHGLVAGKHYRPIAAPYH